MCDDVFCDGCCGINEYDRFYCPLCIPKYSRTPQQDKEVRETFTWLQYNSSIFFINPCICLRKWSPWIFFIPFSIINFVCLGSCSEELLNFLQFQYPLLTVYWRNDCFCCCTNEGCCASKSTSCSIKTPSVVDVQPTHQRVEPLEYISSPVFKFPSERFINIIPGQEYSEA